jgi:heme oxygenase
MDLREAVKDNHQAAERTRWSQMMISGDMRIEQYAAMLYNLHPIYTELERTGLIVKPEVLRAQLVQADLDALGGTKHGLTLSIVYYTRYLESLDDDARWAHIYVHYLGNMYGGQMIGRRLPGPHAHLLFDDLKGCIAYVRGNLTNVSAAEANCAFEWTIKVYDELYNLFG